MQLSQRAQFMPSLIGGPGLGVIGTRSLYMEYASSEEAYAPPVKVR